MEKKKRQNITRARAEAKIGREREIKRETTWGLIAPQDLECLFGHGFLIHNLNVAPSLVDPMPDIHLEPAHQVKGHSNPWVHTHSIPYIGISPGPSPCSAECGSSGGYIRARIFAPRPSACPRRTPLRKSTTLAPCTFRLEVQKCSLRAVQTTAPRGEKIKSRKISHSDEYIRPVCFENA